MRLLAKSGDVPVTLLQHTQDVASAGEAIWQSVSADLSQLIPGLPESFAKWRAIAESLHDLLKANSAYQKMLEANGRTDERQPVRHEVLAAAFLTGDGALADWFVELIPDEKSRWAIVWAIAAHHFKMVDPARNPKYPAYRDANVAKVLTLFLGHPDVKTILGSIKQEVPTLANINFQTMEDDEGSLRERIDNYLTMADQAWDQIQRLPPNKTVIATMKVLVAAADAAGSATAERPLPTAQYVRESLSKRLTVEDLLPVLAKDLGPNLERVKPFQTAVGNSEKQITVVAAGCGNGKTTAAYLWAKKWAIGKKLFFLYPTTGTATAGYESYLADQDGLEKELLHRRSGIDLEFIHGTNEDAAETAVKIESLRAWNPKVASCTVDTVLGLMQTQRRGVYSFPSFAAGAFVFDEIHAYDSKLWGGLLRFLKEYPGVRALLMSASIPKHRQEQLRGIVGERMGEIILGDKDLEGYKRYKLLKRDDESACFKEVKDALSKNKKVLWVCNTVGDSIKILQEVRTWSSVQPIIYHSRFRYGDRVKRQKALMTAFRNDGPLIAITTQVCEMSLDISADLLVTAECPLPSLVQRLGRLNRYASGEDPWPCLVYPFNGLPYNENPEWIDLHGDCIASMKAARDAVEDMKNKPCSQKDLAVRLQDMHDSEEPEMYSALFDDGWVTEPMPVRDGDQSITVILEKDISAITEKLGSNQKFWSAAKLAPWTIPMNYPKWLKPFDWPTAGPYPRADDSVITYSEEEGAQWQTKSTK